MLREGIYAGRFPLGTPLRQEELAAELEISRTPLREAMRMLEREGLLELDRNQGVRVVAPEPGTLLAAYELREVLDGLAARLAARSRLPDLPERLRSIIALQRTALRPWDAARYTSANVEFHGTIIAAAHNSFLTAQLPLVHMTSQVFAPVAHVHASRAESAVAEHVGIADAIEQGGEDAAERLARAHVHRTIAWIQARRSQGDEPAVAGATA